MHHGVMSGERGGIQQGAEAHNRLRCERLASLVTGAGLPRFLEGREVSKEQTERRVCRSSRKKWRRGGTSPRWTIDSLAPDAQRVGKARGVMCESLADALTQCQASVPTADEADWKRALPPDARPAGAGQCMLAMSGGQWGPLGRGSQAGPLGSSPQLE